MASIRMCGVVLWSSQAEGRAVIWCEDHGKLAFYAETPRQQAANGGTPAVCLDAGDLIEFDVEDSEHQRRAHNPRLLVADHAPCIATRLQQEATEASEPAFGQARIAALVEAMADDAPVGGPAGEGDGHPSGAEVVPFRPAPAPWRVRAAG